MSPIPACSILGHHAHQTRTPHMMRKIPRFLDMSSRRIHPQPHPRPMLSPLPPLAAHARLRNNGVHIRMRPSHEIQESSNPGSAPGSEGFPWYGRVVGQALFWGSRDNPPNGPKVTAETAIQMWLANPDSLGAAWVWAWGKKKN
ncbi:hypothetical protein K432DRAFT_53484 [Lepidopterella palustris CBS 459.81]|uniref:Uncharacterized protein n=1 Tax=Lepidopterella palustris CBS 459.81 TaxID=1314670 RepID=A0A8E2JF14_9PEZI|nr:hypothetical protein K432DRAFT_53484 [Lepidopterella palustris CBS 459.81]